MPMPTFPQIDPPLTREGSINGIISSIAAEELSLSHILNTQGEKLQYVLGTLPGLEKAADLEEVMKVNKSVQDTMSDVMEQQMLLTAKLSAAMKAPVPEHGQQFFSDEGGYSDQEVHGAIRGIWVLSSWRFP